MNKDEVVERISALRTKARLSARDLSLKIGKNAAYISRLKSKNDSFEPSVSARYLPKKKKFEKGIHQ